MPSQDMTKHLLARSMLALSEEMPFDKITVADLARHAGINRKTFYYHFTDKYALLAWFVQSEFDRCRGAGEPEDFWGFYTLLVTCVNQHRAFFKNALSGRDQPHLRDILRRFLHRYVARFVPPARLGAVIKDKYEECVEFLCTTFAASLEEWVVNWPGLSQEGFVEITRFDKIL